jgi:type IV pilus assembly protein PilV
MKARSPTFSRNRQRGVTLIEVLVTVVLVSIGLLGFAALQTVSLKSNRSALQHSYAVMYAYDLLDSMRANRAQAIAGEYDYDFSSTPAGDSTIAASDINAWRDALDENLPNGRGKVDVDNNHHVAVEICWAEGIASNVIDAICSANDGSQAELQYFRTETTL